MSEDFKNELALALKHNGPVDDEGMVRIVVLSFLLNQQSQYIARTMDKGVAEHTNGPFFAEGLRVELNPNYHMNKIALDDVELFVHRWNEFYAKR